MSITTSNRFQCLSASTAAPSVNDDHFPGAGHTQSQTPSNRTLVFQFRKPLTLKEEVRFANSFGHKTKFDDMVALDDKLAREAHENEDFDVTADLNRERKNPFDFVTDTFRAREAESGAEAAPAAQETSTAETSPALTAVKALWTRPRDSLSLFVDSLKTTRPAHPEPDAEEIELGLYPSNVNAKGEAIMSRLTPQQEIAFEAISRMERGLTEGATERSGWIHSVFKLGAWMMGY